MPGVTGWGWGTLPNRLEGATVVEVVTVFGAGGIGAGYAPYGSIAYIWFPIRGGGKPCRTLPGLRGIRLDYTSFTLR